LSHSLSGFGIRSRMRTKSMKLQMGRQELLLSMTVPPPKKSRKNPTRKKRRQSQKKRAISNPQTVRKIKSRTSQNLPPTTTKN